MEASFIYVQFSDGKQYRIPAEFIAKHRATYYAAKDLERGRVNCEEVFNQDIEYALRSKRGLLSWASNNMDWSDVEDIAALIIMQHADQHEEWQSADKWIQFTGGESIEQPK